MFHLSKKEKKVSAKKQIRVEAHQKRLALKKQNKAMKAEAKKLDAKKEVSKVGKKAISRLAIAGSRVVGSAIGVLGGATYYSYVASGPFSHITIMYGVGTMASSLLAAAPYARSVARTNKSLLSVDTKLTQVDEMIGSQKELVSSAIASLEAAARKPQVSQADILEIKNKLAEVHAKVNVAHSAPQVESASAPSQREVHVAPPKSNSHIAK